MNTAAWRFCDSFKPLVRLEIVMRQPRRLARSGGGGNCKWCKRWVWGVYLHEQYCDENPKNEKKKKK